MTSPRTPENQPTDGRPQAPPSAPGADSYIPEPPPLPHWLNDPAQAGEPTWDPLPPEQPPPGPAPYAGPLPAPVELPHTPTVPKGGGPVDDEPLQPYLPPSFGASFPPPGPAPAPAPAPVPEADPPTRRDRPFGPSALDQPIGPPPAPAPVAPDQSPGPYGMPQQPGPPPLPGPGPAEGDPRRRAPAPVYEPWRLERPRRRGPLVSKRVVIGGVAVVVVVGLGATGAIALFGGDGKSAVEAGSRLAGSVFTAIPGARDGRDQELNDISTAGTTVVAVGNEAGPDYVRGQFLYSTDNGASFRLADIRTQDGNTPDPGEVPRFVTGSSHGWVALGTRFGGVVAWTSPDGKVWRRQPDSATSGFDPGFHVDRLIATGSGFLAVGAIGSRPDLSDAVPAAWSSSDGRRWIQRTGGQLGLDEGKGTLRLVNATANGNTVLVQGVFDPNGKPQPRRRVWRSTDGGSNWKEAKIPAPSGTVGLSIGGGPAGFLAIREIRKGSSVFGQAFSSSDGAKWTKAGTLKVDGYRQVTHLLGAEKGYTAMIDQGATVALLRSTDGASWQAAGTVSQSAGRITPVAAATADRTFTAGRDVSGGDSDAALTVVDAQGKATPIDFRKVPGAVAPDQAVRDVATSGGQQVAVGGTSGDGAIWTSRDGVSWQRAQAAAKVLDRPGWQRLEDVTRGGQGWLAVGYTGQAPRRPLVVTSADGTTWQAADSAQPFAAKDGVQLLTTGVAAGPAGYVIVGAEGPGVAAWYSADLRSFERAAGAGAQDFTPESGGALWMRSVAGGSFGYVAVGGRFDPKAADGRRERPVIWTSANGKTWALRELPLPSGVAAGPLLRVEAKGNVLTALGTGITSNGGRVPLAYVSADGGKTWQQARIPAPSGARDLEVTALTTTANGFAAAGMMGGRGAADVVLWTSPDGRTWTPQTPHGTGLSGQGEQEITGLTGLPDVLLGIGETTDHTGDEPTLWREPLG